MSYDRGAEPRRSPSGGRASYGGRRGGRGDQRSPEFRPQRGTDYHRRPYHNPSPEYSDRYRRRSPSAPRHGRDTRAYRGGRSAPYRLSRSRSPWHRRSRSLDSYTRNERYPQRDAPSARFGSKASYLRSRDAQRGPSRSPSRSGRRQSFVPREQRERRDVGNRSESRGRYRERREDFRERRRHASPERQLRRNRTPERCEPPYYKGRSTRQPCSPDRHAAVNYRSDGRGSQRSECHQHSPNGSRERKASSPIRRSLSRDGNRKWPRSRTRSGSGSRNRAAATPSQRLPDIDRSRRSRERKGATLTRHSSSNDRSLRRRSCSGSRRKGYGTPNRRSPSHDERSRRRSCSGSRRRGDGTPLRHSPHHDSSPRLSHSVSRERVADAPSRRSQQQEQHSHRASSCRSADCPTPDLSSSRSWNADNEGANLPRRSVGQESNQIPSLEASRADADANELREKHASGRSEASCDRREGLSKATKNESLSRSHSVHIRDTEVGHDGTKDRLCSRPPTPTAQKQAAPEEPRKPSEASKPLSAPEGPGEENSVQGAAPSQQQGETTPKEDCRAAPAEFKRNRSSSLISPASRQQSEGCQHGDHKRSSGPPVVVDTGTDDARDSPPIDEPRKPYARLNSDEDAMRNREVDRTVVSRRIVAVGPRATPPGAGERNRAPRESPPRRYYRVQRPVPGRGDRVLSSVNRFHPAHSNGWNRFSREERFDLPYLPHPSNAGRSVRIVGGYSDRNSFSPLHYHGAIATPNEAQRMQLHNGSFQRPGRAHLRIPQKGREMIQQAGAGSRKMAGILGRGQQDRRQAAAASNADGKWSHDLFEQLSNEPERKRRRFNLYGETLETVDD